MIKPAASGRCSRDAAFGTAAPRKACYSKRSQPVCAANLLSAVPDGERGPASPIATPSRMKLLPSHRSKMM